MILNFTGKETTSEYKDFGVIDIPERAYLSKLLVFKTKPSYTEIEMRASLICEIISKHKKTAITNVLVEAPQFLVPSLIRRIKGMGVFPFFEYRVDGQLVDLICI